MLFVSIMGTQVMAVLNPILSFMGEKQPDPKLRLSEVRLLATERTLGQAGTVQNFLADVAKDGAATPPVKILPISDSLQTDSGGRQPAHRVLCDLLRDNTEAVGFNIAGGMNFQVSASLAAAHQFLERILFIYPESGSVHVFTPNSGHTAVKHHATPIPDPLEILRLQGVTFCENAPATDNFFNYLVGKYKLTLPASMKAVEIKGVPFHAVFNTTNELHFVKVIHKGRGDKRKSPHFLKEVRNLISLVNQRPIFGELYHRTVALLTNLPTVAEHARKDSGGKIFVFLDVGDAENSEQDIQRLRSFFQPSPPAHSPRSDCHTPLERCDGSVLYAAVGRNLMPTLIALYSHKPDEARLLFTPSDPTICEYARRIEKGLDYLPVKRLRFIPTSVVGHEFLKLQHPEGEENVCINVSPGTKGHAAFLTHWGAPLGIPIWSIKTGGEYLVKLPDGETGNRVASPPPLGALINNGIDISNPGWNKKQLEKKSELLSDLLSFLTCLVKEDVKRIDGFPEKPTAICNATYQKKDNKGCIQWENKMQTHWSLSQDAWFEDLIGHVMLRCGADHVQVRVKTQWPDKIQGHLQSRHGARPYPDEMDVIAQFGVEYYVISCKATKKKSSESLAREAAAMAGLLGRFAHPLLCFLKYTGDPHEATNGTTIFGIKTFTNLEAMAALLKTEAERKRTTGRMPPSDS